MSSKIISVRGYTCAKIYRNEFGFLKAYSIDGNDKQNLGDILSLIIQDAGVMQKLHTYNAPEIVKIRPRSSNVQGKKA